ncbi:MAG: hypothetical protein J2P36_35805, partial [Ktedonobacteraceae bacterium]|nr:hypothetical protein [Ktedonobacteraceae bacterium]
DQQGIAWQGNRLFWPEVKGFEINERIGSISIRKHGKWFRWAGIATGRVPNIEVLKAVIRPYVQV